MVGRRLQALLQGPVAAAFLKNGPRPCNSCDLMLKILLLGQWAFGTPEALAPNPTGLLAGCQQSVD